MFLRHGNDSIAALRQNGATVEEFTAIQPIGSKYDYFNPKKERVHVVVVLVEDQVYGVFRVLRVEAEGTNHSLGSEPYRRFDSNKRTRSCRRFSLQRLSSISTGLPVRGWERRTRTPVQRSSDSFFDEIEVDLSTEQGFREAVEASFQAQVNESLLSTPEELTRRLAQSSDTPARVAVSSFVFTRNADVVAMVLMQAKGNCHACGAAAPFLRRSDGTPYLEVHHRTPLAEGGKDNVANAVALCPNCHRKAHYAYPSVKPTRSGLRPPHAAYLKR